MRTKQTGAKRAHAHAPNSKSKSKKRQSESGNTQDVVTSLDRKKLGEWLDTMTAGPWQVHTVPFSNKRKRDAANLSVEDNVSDPRLKVQFEVRPRDKWHMLKTYKKFTVSGESIEIGDAVLVGHNTNLDEVNETVDVAEQWKAVVLEIRALDSEHVYARVSWLNRPEDLDTGRKDYHGESELIPTNQMDVIDAMTVNGRIDLVHLDESDFDSQTPVENHQYFWRQTYDFVGGKTFSKLRQICKDKKPQNPDKVMIQCSNEDCQEWLHASCIVEDAVQTAAAKTKSNTPKKLQKPRSVHSDSQRPNGPAAKATLDGYTVELYLQDNMQDLPTRAGAEESDEIGVGLPSDKNLVTPPPDKPVIVITDPKGEKHAQDLSCLCCSRPIE